MPRDARDLLMPAGEPIGMEGSWPAIREIPGGRTAADDFFRDLTLGGIPVSLPGYPGTMFDLPGGGRVGLRPISKSGVPTIDIDIAGIPIKKLKFI